MVIGCSILDEFAEMGGIHVTLSGGEAFLHKDIIEITEYCREKDLKITGLNRKIEKVIMSQYKKRGLFERGKYYE